MKPHISYFVLWLLHVGIAYGNDNQNNFTLDDGFRLRTFDERIASDVTRDGQLVAISMSSPANQVAFGPFNLSTTGVTIDVAGDELWLIDTRQKTTRKLSHDKELAWAPRWSPDSMSLAYYSDRRGKPRLWIWDRITSKSTPVSDRIVRTMFGFESPEWSPDSRYVYFKSLSRRWERFYRRANVNYVWAPFVPRQKKAERKDQRSRLVTVRRSGPTEAIAHSVAATGESLSDEGIYDLVRYDRQTGSVENVVTSMALRDFDIAPDGNLVAASVLVQEEGSSTQQLIHRLIVASATDNLKKDTPCTLVDRFHESYGISISWSPDSKRIAFVTSGVRSQGDLYVVEIDSGRIRNLTQDFDLRLTGPENQRRPVWTESSTDLLIVASEDLWRFSLSDAEPENLTRDFAPAIAGPVCENQSSIAWRSREKILCQFKDSTTNESGFCEVSLTGSVRELRREQRHYGRSPRFHVDVAPTTGEIIYRATDAKSPGIVQMATSDFSEVQPLPSANDWLRDFDLGREETISWTLSDGRSMEGLLLLPSNADLNDSPPCIGCVYPGISRSEKHGDFRLALTIGDSTNANPRFFLGAGLAVFFPDMPSTQREPMRQIWQSIEPALDALEVSQLVDMQRIGLFGHSYGGYAVNSLVVQTNRFAAAVSCTGFSNLVSGSLRAAGEHGNTGWFQDGQLGLRVAFSDDPRAYTRNSPVFHVSKVTTPLLLIHGEEDAEYQQALEMFGALRQAGKTAELVTYGGAGHAFGSYRPEQVRDFWRRVFGWYHLRLVAP